MKFYLNDAGIYQIILVIKHFPAKLIMVVAGNST